MIMTPAEFQKLMGKNPNIRIHQFSLPSKSSSSPTQIPSFYEDSEMDEEIKTRKYRNKKVFVSSRGTASHNSDSFKPLDESISMVFDSTKEFLRWKDLLLLERVGKIRKLERQRLWIVQESFKYQGETIRAIYYQSDFQYERQENGVWVSVVEDVKPFDEKSGKYRTTPAFAIKWKLLKHRYPETHFVLY